MKSKPLIAVFEDRGDNWDRLSSELGEYQDEHSLEPKLFPPEKEFSDSDRLDKLKEWLVEIGPPALVMLDLDLGEAKHAIDRGTVRSACEELELPLCEYHRQGQSRTKTDILRDYDEKKIKLDPTLGWEEIAKNGIFLAEGFLEIQDKILTKIEGDGLEDEDRGIFSVLLGAPPGISQELQEYSGVPRPMEISEDAEVESLEFRRWTTETGYWIHNILLQFPGEILNEIAAAAYLDVGYEGFRAVIGSESLFDKAEYGGPFAELGKWFWKEDLDRIRSGAMGENDSNIPLGPELFDKMELGDIGQSICNDEEHGPHKGARYYCPILKKPVCREHSMNPPGWIPKGASRTRISQTEYHMEEPWM